MTWPSIEYFRRQTSFIVDRYFDFIGVSAENVTSHKHVAQNAGSKLRAVLEIQSSVYDKNLLDERFMKLLSATQTGNLSNEIFQYNTTRRNTNLTLVY